MATPNIRTPAAGVMKFTILVDPSFGRHYYIIRLSGLCLGVKKILKIIIHFHYNDLFGYTLAQEPLPLGS